MTQNADPGAHTREAEKMLLASMLRDNSTIPDVIAAGLLPKHFYGFGNQKICEAILRLHEQNKVADLVTVAEWLRKKKLEVDVPASYLAELMVMVRSGAQLSYHAQIVIDHWIFHQTGHACNEILQLVDDRACSPAELLDSAEKKILSIAESSLVGSTIPMPDLVRESWERYEQREKRGDSYSGIPSGILELDRLTGGLQDSELIILAARPSVGKTSLAQRVAGHAAIELRLPVAFVSLEQSREELTDRLVCCQGQIDHAQFRHATMTRDEKELAWDAGEALREAKLTILDNADQTMMRIAANARRLKKREGLRLLIIDYLQLVTPDSTREPRHEQVANISRRLKLLARELKIPVLALAQLNREVEKGQSRKPRLSDLRESGSIEADADTVILMHRPEAKDGGLSDLTVGGYGSGLIELIVAKQRNGPTGSALSFFANKSMRFDNLFV